MFTEKWNNCRRTMIRLKKCLLLTMVMTLLMMGTVMAGGFSLSFYQAMEGQEINMVDEAGNVLETVTIDAMGRANFTQPLLEGYTLEMDLSEPEDLESIRGRVVTGYSLATVIGIAVLVGVLVFGITAIYLKRTLEKKYEFLLEYEYNALLDDDE